MARAFPMIVIFLFGGIITSLLGGFLIASWTMAGAVPATSAPPTLARADKAVVSDGWREAGYERIGLWETPRIAPDYADGSSRL